MTTRMWLTLQTSQCADSSAAADAEEDAKPKAMDRARSAYLIEGPDGDFACGVRISSFTMHRQRTASLELPATVPGAAASVLKSAPPAVRGMSIVHKEPCSMCERGVSAPGGYPVLQITLY